MLTRSGEKSNIIKLFARKQKPAGRKCKFKVESVGNGLDRSAKKGGTDCEPSAKARNDRPMSF